MPRRLDPTPEGAGALCCPWGARFFPNWTTTRYKNRYTIVMTTTERSVKRKWLPLSEGDLEVIEQITHGEDTARNALEHMGITLPGDANDTEVVRAIFAAGRAALEEKTLELGYAKAAEFDRTDPERQTWMRCMRSRRRTLPNHESTP